MTTQRLPVPGSDDGSWGTILNGFLSVELNTDGTLKARTDGTLAPLVSGKVPATNLATGTASSSTYLRGDGTWATPAGGGTVTSVTATDATIIVGGTGNAPTIGVNAIAESKVTNLTTDLAAKAPLASPTFTGKVTTPALQVTTGAGTANQVLTSDISGNATWAAPATAPVTSVNTRTGAITLTSTDVGLANVSNTSDATKNSATATLTNKTLTSPAITTPTGIVKSDVGLANVDNTSDATKNSATATLTNKTISGASNTLSSIPESAITNLTADLAAKVASVAATDATITVGGTSAAPTIGVNAIAESKVTNLTTDLAAKAPLASPTFTGKVTTPALQVTTGAGSANQVLTSDVSGNATWAAPATAPVVSVNTRVGAITLTSTDVGLANVDNTSDITKNSAAVTLTNKTISGSSNTLSNIPESAVTNLTTDLSAKEAIANKGAVNGYAGLNGSSQVPIANLPTGATSTTVALGNDTRITGALQSTNNLSDLANASTARANLGVKVTKRATQNTGSPNSTFSSGGGFTYMQRVIIMLPVTTKQWRLKIANKDAQAGTTPGNFGTLDSVWVGAPAYATNSRWIGNCTAALTQVVSASTTIAANGADATTSWVTAGGGQFVAHQPLVISMAMTLSSGGSGIIQNDTLGFTGVGSNASVGTATAPLSQGPFVLDVRIEYDADVDITTPVGFIVTASDGSFNPDNALLPCEAWPGVMALRSNHLIINGALGGSATPNWTSAAGRPYTRFDLTTNVPDYAIIGLGVISNSIGGMTGGDTATGGQITTALTAIQTDVSSIMTSLRSLGINRIYLPTVPPRNFSSGGSFENLRGQLNAWLRSLPLGAEGIREFERNLRNPTTLYQLDPLFAASDGVHLNRGGEQEAGSIPMPNLSTV
jgi:hypothetical protein